MYGSTPRGPIAIKSKLGWLLFGPIKVSATRYDITHSNLIIEAQESLLAGNEDDALVNALKSFWEAESIGIKDLPSKDLREESFATDVKQNADRYEVKLPWKRDCKPSSDNYQLSESPLKSSHHKLRKDPELLSEYDKII